MTTNKHITKRERETGRERENGWETKQEMKNGRTTGRQLARHSTDSSFMQKENGVYKLDMQFVAHDRDTILHQHISKSIAIKEQEKKGQSVREQNGSER